MALFWTSGYVVGALTTAHTPALTVSFWRLVVATPLVRGIALAAGAVAIRAVRGAASPSWPDAYLLAVSVALV